MCRPAVCASRRARFVRCSAVRPAVDKPNSGTGQRRRGRPPPRHCGAAGTRQRRGPRASSSGEVVWSRRTFICFLRIRGSCVSCFLLLYLPKYVLSKCVMVGALLLYVLKYAYQVSVVSIFIEVRIYLVFKLNVKWFLRYYCIY